MMFGKFLTESICLILLINMINDFQFITQQTVAVIRSYNIRPARETPSEDGLELAVFIPFFKFCFHQKLLPGIQGDIFYSKQIFQEGFFTAT